ncbi:hypothetical protein GALL_539640 [mine drainage metagenome]|uniref:Uncharacterized protein n=1 Tax=mine drainage metagenome TaxID=410659 RepID=A0A1J5P073_9ZZZZ
MNSQPRNAMENGLTSQLTNSVTPMPRTCWRTSCSAEKSTLTSIGMIITQISKPTGKFTCATSMRPIAWNTPGSHCPKAIPATMHRKTQTDRKRSNPLMGAPAARWPVTSQDALMAYDRLKSRAVLCSMALASLSTGRLTSNSSRRLSACRVWRNASSFCTSVPSPAEGSG